MEIRQLLDGIKNNEMVMPEFQREYVWSLEQAKQLLVSLYKSYPTGSLLFWATENPPEIKNDAVQKERIGLTKVILDGQQRLTTLYLLLMGKIPPYYKKEDLTNDPRHLYFNIKNSEFSYFMKTKMENDPFWVKVIDVFTTDDIDPIDIAEKHIEQNTENSFKEILKILNKNLNQLKRIKEISYPIQIVPSDAEIDEAIDVFDRVNSKGTKLTDAELVLTHITGRRSQARRIIKEKIEKLGKENFNFNLDFFTRCLVIALTNSALYKSINYSKLSEEDYIKAWKKISKIFDYLIPILKQSALISGTNDMSTVNVLVPIVAYLLQNDCNFTEEKRNGFLYRMFLAMIWGRYSGQTDQRLDKDVYLSINNKPIINLIKEIVDLRGRVEIKPADLEGRTAGHPLYRMLYIITKHNKAIDRSNGGTIYDTIGDYYSIQSHHIFPQSFLYKNGYNSDNLLDKKKVNEIANRAFITRDTNLKISDKNPFEYLKQINQKFNNALKKQFIPINEKLWKIENFEEFLSIRRIIIAEKINNFLETFKKNSIKKENSLNDTNWIDLISKGENNFIEFKSSLRWSYQENIVNKKLEYVIAKTISAFLNSEGGTLFIGIDDEGKILGLGKDVNTLKNKNIDGFLLQIDQIINDYLGKEFHQFLSVKIEKVNNIDICIIEIANSQNPVFIKNKDKNKEEFYIRASASSQPMSVRETNDYISMHWN